MKIASVVCLWFGFSVAAEAAIQIERHENFIAPGREEDIKVQVSLQHQFITLVPLYYAYTFQGFWETYEDSMPFREINHNPEMFYRFSWGEVGYEHFSNGRDNKETEDGRKNLSRSLERAYVVPRWLVAPGIAVAPRLSVPVYYQNHSEVHEYLGNWDLEVVWAGRHSDARVAWRQGNRGGGILVAGSFNPGSLFSQRYEKANRTFFYWEGFHGYAESLLDYDKKTSNVRVGLRFVLD